MRELHKYGLIRINKTTGNIDTTMTALGRGMIQVWAMQNTLNTKATVIVDIDERKVFAEYIGTEDGFPEIRKDSETFEYNIPDELFDILAEETENLAV